MHPRFVLFALPVLLAGCDLLGIETSSQIEAKKEAEGRAIGSACRQAVRSIEDCYGQNAKAHKAAVFAGWREMDQYMRENNIAGMPFTDKKLPMITEKADEVPPAAQPAQAAKNTPTTGAVPTAARPAPTSGAARAVTAATNGAPNTTQAATPGATPRPSIVPPVPPASTPPTRPTAPQRNNG